MNFFLRRSKSLKPQVRITEDCLKRPFHQCPTRHPGLAVTAAREALWDHAKKNLKARRQEAKKLCLAAEAAAAVEQTAAAAARDTPPASTPVSAGRTLPQPDKIDDYDGRDASDDEFDNMAGYSDHATPLPVTDFNQENGVDQEGTNLNVVNVAKLAFDHTGLVGWLDCLEIRMEAHGINSQWTKPGR